MSTYRYNKRENVVERVLNNKVSKVYTPKDIERWVSFGQRIGLYKVDGSTDSEKSIFAWVDYLLKTGNVSI